MPAFTLTGKRRKQKELPESEWAYPPGTPCPHPDIVMGNHPSLIDGIWVWPKSDGPSEQLPNLWQDWPREEDV